MNHSQFLAAVKQGQIGKCYLFTGEEEYIKQFMLGRLRQKLLPPGLEVLNETILINPDADALMAACETLPFLAEKRLVIVKESKLFVTTGKEEGDNLSSDVVEYLDRLPESVCLVFYVKGKVDARKKLVSYCQKKVVVVDFSPLEEEECVRWAIGTLKSQGKQISAENAGLLVFTVGNDISLLHQEIDKLCSYVEDRTDIEAEDIHAICTPSTECTVFQMVDAQVAGKLDETFRLLSNLYKNGEDGMMVLAMLLRQYRILYHTRCLMDEGNVGRNQAALIGIPPFALDRTCRQAKRYSQATLKEAYETILDYEYRIKQGKLSAEGCAETAILRLQYLLNPVKEA